LFHCGNEQLENGSHRRRLEQQQQQQQQHQKKTTTKLGLPIVLMGLP
jgi:hypothetical protein